MGFELRNLPKANDMRDFRKYNVWEKSHEFVLRIYDFTRTFPNEEIFGITSQIRRASSSIPTNIAEGCGRGSDADFKRFLVFASGSASEVTYLLILAKDLNYLNTEDFESLEKQIIIIHKSIYSLINKLK